MPIPNVYIVGVGDDGVASLSQKALDIICGADLLLGSQRLLDHCPDITARKVPIGSNLQQLAELITGKRGTEKVVVLASGDPNFFGIAKYLVKQLGKDGLEIIPNISSMQLAFARIKESWDDATLTSVHGRAIGEIVDLVRCNRKIGILTDERNSPGEIAKALLGQGLAGYRAYVGENLGGKGERVIETDLAGLIDLTTSPLNVLVLVKQDETRSESEIDRRHWSLGIPDGEFFQRRPVKGLITKAEVRVVSLSKLNLRDDSVVWDIGAGSGSVSIEAALIARRGQVYAVERNPTDAGLIRRNVRKFAVDNLQVLEGLAPQALESLPDPDSVFIGGSGGQIEGVLDVVCRRIRNGGTVVANFATLANLNSAVQALASLRFEFDITLVNVARSKGVADLLRFEALDPVFIVRATRSVDQAIPSPSAEGEG